MEDVEALTLPHFFEEEKEKRKRRKEAMLDYHTYILLLLSTYYDVPRSCGTLRLLLVYGNRHGPTSASLSLSLYSREEDDTQIEV